MDSELIYDDYGAADTEGRLFCNGRWWYVITRPKNDPLHPCLPPGVYKNTKGMHYGKQHPDQPPPVPYPCYHLSNEHFPLEREYEIHIGNKASDSEGCQIIGSDRVTVNGIREVLHSAQAHTQWMQAMNDEEGTLTIKESGAIAARAVAAAL